MKPVKFKKFMDRKFYQNADVVEIFDTNGREVHPSEDIDDAMVLDYRKRGGWLEITIQRPRIQYNQISISRENDGRWTCWARVNGYYYSRSYLYYTKKEAISLFYTLVNKMVA